MKTAMQELIDFGWDNVDTNPLLIVRKAQQLLEKEKQQIMEAYHSAETMMVDDNKEFQSGNDYFNKTFTK